MRTVVVLRTVGTQDPEPDSSLAPADVVIERVEVDDATDPEFRRRCVDTGRWTTPMYWPDMLASWTERCANAVAAVARARPGGVVVSCGIGRDRTGLVTFLLLALAGVPVEDIAADWSYSSTRLAADPLAATPSVAKIIDREQTTVPEAVEAALELDVEARLVAGGLDHAEIATARARLVG